MALYFLDFHNDICTTDTEGVELPDLAVARERAIQEALGLMRASIDEGHIDLCHHVNVRDESGLVVCTVRFEDIVCVKRGDQILSQPAANS